MMIFQIIIISDTNISDNNMLCKYCETSNLQKMKIQSILLSFYLCFILRIPNEIKQSELFEKLNSIFQKNPEL